MNKSVNIEDFVKFILYHKTVHKLVYNLYRIKLRAKLFTLKIYV